MFIKTQVYHKALSISKHQTDIDPCFLVFDLDCQYDAKCVNMCLTYSPIF